MTNGRVVVVVVVVVEYLYSASRSASNASIMRWSQLRFDFDSTAVRRRSLRSQWRNTPVPAGPLTAVTLFICLGRSANRRNECRRMVKEKVRTLDIAPVRESSPNRSAQVRHVFSRDLTVLPAHPHVQSAIGRSHTCLCLPSYSWYSFADPGGMECWVGLGGWLRSETVYLPMQRQSPIQG